MQRIPTLFIMLAAIISTDLKVIVLCTIVPSTRKDANLTLWENYQKWSACSLIIFLWMQHIEDESVNTNTNLE